MMRNKAGVSRVPQEIMRLGVGGLLRCPDKHTDLPPDVSRAGERGPEVVVPETRRATMAGGGGSRQQAPTQSHLIDSGGGGASLVVGGAYTGGSQGAAQSTQNGALRRQIRQNIVR